MAKNTVLNITSDSELLSYIINVTPELASDIDLPVQGESILPIGKLIVNNERYKNAFLNTVNIIGLTLIKRNQWENPWEVFTNKGTLRYGQQVRELIQDLAAVYDYNTYANNATHFLQSEVPNIYQFMHEVNFQKFYKTTTSDEQLMMAFEQETLIDFVTEVIGNLYESWQYDKYTVDKYMLCRRILDGTMTSVEIDNFDSNTVRENVSAMKAVSNKMTFKNPNYNPAGVRRATKFDDQYLIINSEFEAALSTEVLATSFFRNDAEFKSRSALIDSFSVHDTERLAEVLGDQYVELTADELEALAAVPAVLISEDFFMDYLYNIGTDGIKQTDFLNPETLKHNFYLHVWGVFSTSPYANGAVFTEDVTPSVTSITLSPATATVSAGLSVTLTPTVVTTGFANKAVTWSLSEGAEASITVDGVLTVNADATSASTITVTATSVYDPTVTGTATITVA